MEIRVCTNKIGWKNDADHQEFLQSWEWGEFQEKAGNKVLRLQAIENNEVVWQGQVMEFHLPVLGKYLYFPRFKIFDFRFQNVIDELRKMNYVFIRLESISNVNLQSSIHNLKFVRNRQPQHTLVLDLTKSEEEILQGMHEKTRYNIRLAQKKELRLSEEKNIEYFWKLNEETSARDKIRTHDKEYYKKMLDLEMAYQLTLFYKDKPLCSNIFINYNKTFTYLHGASSNEFRNFMAPYLLQWEGMKLGKHLGCEQYDFWGIAPIVKEPKDDDFLVAELARPEAGLDSPRFKNHDAFQCFHNICWEANNSRSGITRFKVGFGGEVKRYPDAFDVILNPLKYQFYKFARKMRGLK